MIFAALSDAVVVALIVGVGGLAATISPIFVAHLMNNAAARAKRADWERQDLIAARLEAGQKMTETRLDVVTEQNKVIHALVNSSYTASLEAQLVALEGQIALSRELAAMKGDNNPLDAARLVSIVARAEVLSGIIDDRKRQQAAAEARAARLHLPISPPAPQ